MSTIPHIVIRFQGSNSVSGSGIGQATAIACARAGCQSLTLVDMNAAGFQKTKELIKSFDKAIKMLELLVDVSDETAVEHMVKKTVDTFGGLDYGKCLTAERSYKFSHYSKLSMSLV
jgi:enoyl-[acyl-carrier-protein] reductase (NADH)